MSIKVTKVGKEILESRLEALNSKLKNIVKLKNAAYTNTGDTWHDNPYFNKLEQDERVENKNIKNLEDILATAEFVEWEMRNTEIVEIGSIVLCKCQYPTFTEKVVYEIVGYGESDFDNGKISYDTPVGKQIIGLIVGEVKNIETPGGSIHYEILKMYESWDKVEEDQI